MGSASAQRTLQQSSSFTTFTSFFPKHAPRQTLKGEVTGSVTRTNACAPRRSGPLKPSTPIAIAPQPFTILQPSPSPTLSTALQQQPHAQKSVSENSKGASTQAKTTAQSRALPPPSTARLAQPFDSLPRPTTLPMLSNLQQPSIHWPSVPSQPSISSTIEDPLSTQSTSGKPNNQQVSGPSLPHVTKLSLAKIKKAKEQKP